MLAIKKLILAWVIVVWWVQEEGGGFRDCVLVEFIKIYLDVCLQRRIENTIGAKLHSLIDTYIQSTLHRGVSHLKHPRPTAPYNTSA